MSENINTKGAVYTAEERLQQVFDVQRKMGTREHAEFGQTFILEPERWFRDVGHVQEYVDNLTANRWFLDYEREHLRIDQRSRVRVKDGNYSNKASFSYSKAHGAIILTPGNDFGLRQMTVLHELAHYLGNRSTHGEKFRNAILFLVEQELGIYTSRLLALYYAEELTR